MPFRICTHRNNIYSPSRLKMLLKMDQLCISLNFRLCTNKLSPFIQMVKQLLQMDNIEEALVFVMSICANCRDICAPCPCFNVADQIFTNCPFLKIVRLSVHLVLI